METLTFLFTSSFYPPFHIGGDAVHVSYLAKELAKRGHEVHVLHSLDAYRVKKRPLPTARESNNVIRHPIETTLSLSAYAAYVLGGSGSISRRFSALIEEVRPDVVHHHNISLLGYDILLKRGDYMNIYTAHDYWLVCPQSNLLRRGGQVCETASCTFCGLYYKRPPQVWRHLKRFRNAIKDIDILIAPSNYLKTRITSRFPIKAVTIQNFAPTPPRRIDSSGFLNFLMYAGVLEKHKGIIPLLDAWIELAKHTGLKLVIVGDGMLKQEVHELIKKNGLESIVFALGWVDSCRMYALLKDANALVVPSISPENAPLVGLEALSVGTPVVGSNRGGLPEIVSKLDRRLIFSWEDSRDLVTVASFLQQNYDELRKRANKTYRQYFSPEVYLASYMKLLRKSATDLRHEEISKRRKDHEAA